VSVTLVNAQTPTPNSQTAGYWELDVGSWELCYTEPLGWLHDDFEDGLLGLMPLTRMTLSLLPLLRIVR